MIAIGRLFLCTFLVSLAATPVASAQTSSAADTEEVNSYRLSEPALAKYADATHRLADILAENPPPCGEDADDSLDALAARLYAIPGASAAIGAAGMSSREYLVFGLATFQAGMGDLDDSGEWEQGDASEYDG